MEQPNLATRLALMQIEGGIEESVTIPHTRKKVRIKFLTDYTLQKITRLLLEREELEEAAKGKDANAVMRSAVKHPYFSIKMAALAALNTPFKIAVFYPFLWRWWAFVRHFTEEQMAPVAEAIQKKNQLILHSVLDGYQILVGYEDGHDDDDEGRTRGIPARTHAGRIAAFVKDFPQYGDSRWVPFVGRIVNYTARCVLSASQVALMQGDLPHTLYLKDKKNGARNSKATADVIRKQEEANARAIARRKAQQESQGYTVEEIFNGEADNK